MVGVWGGEALCDPAGPTTLFSFLCDSHRLPVAEISFGERDGQTSHSCLHPLLHALPEPEA